MTKHSRVLGIGLIAVGLVAAACGSDDKSSSTTTAAAGGGVTTTVAGATTSAGASGGATTASGKPSDPLEAAVAATAQAKKGTNRPVDPTPRAAAKGKHIVVISAAQSQISSSVPVAGAEAAAKAMGWQVDIYDAKGNPGNFGPLVRQAVAAGVDGIVLDAIDCQAAKQALQEAKAKGIVTVPIYAFDCNDPHAGGEAEGLFSAQVNYGDLAPDPGALAEKYGADQANYIIADSGNKAKIIVLNDPEFVVLYYTYTGFKNQIEASGGSEIVDTLEFTVADLLNGQIVAKVQAELLRHPEATWIKSPYTAATIVGVVPGLGAKAGTDVKVMGGEGFEPELDLARQGKVTAMNIISSEWTGWASVDAMNSTFLKQPTVDSGIGWTIVDKDNNLPASGEYIPPVDFKAQFEKAWGVG